MPFSLDYALSAWEGSSIPTAGCDGRRIVLFPVVHGHGPRYISPSMGTVRGPGGWRRRRMACAAVALAVGVVCADRAEGAGARSFKSGPIQITADGTRVWVVNPDHDSVSRIDTSTDAVVEFPLPQPAGPPER